MVRRRMVDGLRALLAEVDGAGARGPGRSGRGRRRGPGRPVKIRAATTAVVLHLYQKQVEWLDDYAEFLTGLAEGNKQLSRVEIVRAILLALAEHVVERGVALPAGTKVGSERELRGALVAALRPGEPPRDQDTKDGRKGDREVRGRGSGARG